MKDMSTMHEPACVRHTRALSARLSVGGLMLDGTEVATHGGWRRVETLRPGTRILTYQNGFQPLRHVERETLHGADILSEDMWPVGVPAGLLGNVDPVTLLPRESVLRDDAQARSAGTAGLVAAETLVHCPDVERRAPARALMVTRLTFARAQLICVAHGAVLRCPAAETDGAGPSSTGDAVTRLYGRQRRRVSTV